jgi:alanine racemase
MLAVELDPHAQSLEPIPGADHEDSPDCACRCIESNFMWLPSLIEARAAPRLVASLTPAVSTVSHLRVHARVIPLPEGSRTPLRQLPPTRPTRAEVDLTAMAHNLGVERAVAPGSRLYAVVKADAYGHGLVPVARWLEQQGVDGLCVALAEEGLTLRASGVTVPILVLSGAYGDAHERVLAAHLTPVIYNYAQAEAFNRVSSGRPVNVHLKVDTGMGRLGVPVAELPALLDALGALPNLRIDGLMTHLSSADSDPTFTREQLARFEAALHEARDRGFAPRFVHAANSAGTYGFVEAHHNLVRVGLALYGVPPAREQGATLLPVMSLRTEILALRELPAGSPVGYDQTYRTSSPSRIATVAIGYGDGLLRAASNRGAMLVRGQHCPIVGRISMDLTTLDVTAVPECCVGDEVIVIGRQGETEITAQELAQACDTIAYEVLTNISPRVPRMYRYE